MKLANSYQLPNANTHLTPDEIRRALSDFEYFSGNFAQIVNKDRHLTPFALNAFQKYLATELLPLIKKETRLNRNLSLCIAKPRQVGCSVFFFDFLNYICAFLDDFTDTSILMVEPVTDTIAKLYKKKIEPIITGVHPDLMPTMERDNQSSSIITHYKDIRGIRRNNFFELVSSGASSVRSDTINIAIFDEAAFYAHPEVVSDAVIGSMPDSGFSLTIYMSTFEDRRNDFFRNKLQTAMDNPNEWKILFAPWFIMYPEYSTGINYSDLELTEYDRNVIIPEMVKYDIPKERWGDCIHWYHTKSAKLAHMKKEFPTTLDEIMEMSADKKVFSEDAIKWQRDNSQLSGTPMRFVTDNFTGKVEAQSTDASPFRMFKSPIYGHRYKLVVDPITAVSDDTDIFAMAMFDDETLEQVAVFSGKGLQVEDYADYAVSMCKIYNNAIICPESNVAAAFVTAVFALRYYNFLYESSVARKNRTPGIRTTASNKNQYIDLLTMLLDNHQIIIHDEDTLDQLGWFEKKVKNFADGSSKVTIAARKGKHDDQVSCLWIYAATLTQSQLNKGTSSHIGFIGF